MVGAIENRRCIVFGLSRPKGEGGGSEFWKNENLTVAIMLKFNKSVIYYEKYRSIFEINDGEKTL